MGLRINGSTSGYVELNAPSVAGTTNLILPTTGFGKVLQIVRATDSTARTTTSANFVDVTGMSVTITPKSSDSSILLIATFIIYSINGVGADLRGYVQIADSSNVGISGASNALFGTAIAAGQYLQPTTLIGYVSPATTSAVTYKLRFMRVDANTSVSLLNATQSGQMFAIEVAS